MVSYTGSHSWPVGGRLTKAWQPISISDHHHRNIHSHSCEAMWVKCLAKRTQRFKLLTLWLLQTAPAPEPQLPPIGVFFYKIRHPAGTAAATDNTRGLSSLLTPQLDSCVDHHFMCAVKLLPSHHLHLDAKECEELPGCRQMSCGLTLLIQALLPPSGDIIKLCQ